jgi:hypothetical protein
MTAEADSTGPVDTRRQKARIYDGAYGDGWYEKHKRRS